MPVSEYSHQQGRCSVTGGYVYRGQQFDALKGVYFYADYCSGAIWVAIPDGAGGWHSDVVLESGATISSFGQDEAGELYLTDLNKGVVYRLVVAP